MDVQMHHHKTEKLEVNIGNSDQDCWLDITVSHSTFTLHTNVGDFYELGKKIVEEAVKMGAKECDSNS